MMSLQATTVPTLEDEKPSKPLNLRQQMLSQLKHKVSLGKQYVPPAKRHEVRTNNPFFNGAFVGYCKAYADSNVNKSISSSAGHGA